MIDLILFLFSVFLFFGGFWCGSKYVTLRNMRNSVFADLRAFLDSFGDK